MEWTSILWFLSKHDVLNTSLQAALIGFAKDSWASSLQRPLVEYGMPMRCRFRNPACWLCPYDLAIQIFKVDIVHMNWSCIGHALFSNELIHSCEQITRCVGSDLFFNRCQISWFWAQIHFYQCNDKMFFVLCYFCIIHAYMGWFWYWREHKHTTNSASGIFISFSSLPMAHHQRTQHVIVRGSNHNLSLSKKI